MENKKKKKIQKVIQIYHLLTGLQQDKVKLGSLIEQNRQFKVPGKAHTCIYIFIVTDKRRYPHNIFLISRWIHMLWILIRSASPRRGASNEYPQHMFLLRNKKDISIFRMKKAPYLLLCIFFTNNYCSIIFFLFSPTKTCYVYSLAAPLQGVSNE